VADDEQSWDGETRKVEREPATLQRRPPPLPAGMRRSFAAPTRAAGTSAPSPATTAGGNPLATVSEQSLVFFVESNLRERQTGPRAVVPPASATSPGGAEAGDLADDAPVGVLEEIPAELVEDAPEAAEGLADDELVPARSWLSLRARLWVPVVLAAAAAGVVTLVTRSQSPPTTPAVSTQAAVPLRPPPKAPAPITALPAAAPPPTTAPSPAIAAPMPEAAPVGKVESATARADKPEHQPAQRCTVDVDSRPAAAIVESDGRALGATPLRGLSIPCGATLTFKRPRYATTTETVAPGFAGRATVFARLSRPPALLRVASSVPGALLTVDGTPVGRTPTTIDVLRYESVRLRAEVAGHPPWTRQLYVKNAQTNLTATFDDRTP